MNEVDLPRKQLRYREGGDGFRKGLLLFAILSVGLAILPFWISFQDFLTRLVMGWGWYKRIQDIVVPYELRVVGAILSVVGFPIKVGYGYFELQYGSSDYRLIYLIWNCVGWQTVVLFLITLLTGFGGRYTVASKITSFLVGFFGTYLVNIVRLVLVLMVYYLVPNRFGVIFHDYFSNILTLAWLFLFWWFSYKFILEEKG